MQDEEIEVIRECAEEHWLVLEYRDNGVIRVNARALDRILADGHRLILDIGGYTVALHVASGADAARLIVEQLQRYTRSAPIHDDVSYNLAKQIVAGGPSLSEPVLMSGDTQIIARGDTLCAGELTCRLEDAWAAAQEGDHALFLSNGGSVHAELAMIVFAHQRRDEDYELLARRIAEYESRC
jgi:hypothetical protein